MEWLVLALVVPAIVVPVVLLLGFAGCDVFLGLRRVEDPVFEPTFISADFTNVEALPGRCLVQRIEPPRLSDDGTVIQVTISALGQAVVLDRILVSQPATIAGADPFDSADDLTDVAANVQVSPNSSVTLPPVNYVLDRTKPLLVAMDIALSSGPVPFVQPVPATEASAYFRTGAEAALNDRTPPYTPRTRIYLVSRIDVV